MFSIRKIFGNGPVTQDSTHLTIADFKSLITSADPVILDIGANNGDQSHFFAKTFPNASIYSFEPDPRAAAKFREKLNGTPRVFLFETAIGAENKKTTFFQSSGRRPGLDENQAEIEFPSGWDLSGSIRKPKDHLIVHPWCKFETSIEVEMTTLDSWAAKQAFSTVDFIWADVQGAEIDLIEGGRKTLSRTRYFYTEYSNRELYEGQIDLDRIQNLLPAFKIERLFQNDVLFRNRKCRSRPT